jgi:steroid 5-alpha reductase family enzyme
MLSFIAVTFSVALFSALFGFILSRIFQRNDVADSMWGLGILLIATGLFCFNLAEGNTLQLKAKILLSLVFLWSARLSLYLTFRNSQKEEDIRYVRMKQDWGKNEPRNTFLRVFLLQSFLLALVSLAVGWSIYENDAAFGTVNLVGTLVFLIGFVFEGMADAELSAFKKDPKNKGLICESGVWKYCRHPNYFGEIMLWWGLFLVSLNVFKIQESYLALSPIFSPLLITFLILKVSGVGLLEKHLEKSKANYHEYRKKIPAMIPFHKNQFFSFLKTAIAIFNLEFLKDFFLKGYFGWNDSLDKIPFILLFSFAIHFFGVSKKHCASSWVALFKGSVVGMIIFLVSFRASDSLLLMMGANSQAQFALTILWGAILGGAGAYFGVVQNRSQSK